MLREEVGPLTGKHRQLVTVLEVARIEVFVRTWAGLPGRPLSDRHALARAFIAKAVLGLPTTSALIERLAVDSTSRRLCGWERRSQVPSKSTFSRAFAEFAETELPARAHEALIKATHADRLVGHISRDSTAVEAREKPVKAEQPPAPRRRRGRPRKGEVGPNKAPRRLERQMGQTLPEMLTELQTKLPSSICRRTTASMAKAPKAAHFATCPAAHARDDATAVRGGSPDHPGLVGAFASRHHASLRRSRRRDDATRTTQGGCCGQRNRRGFSPKMQCCSCSKASDNMWRQSLRSPRNHALRAPRRHISTPDTYVRVAGSSLKNCPRFPS